MKLFIGTKIVKASPMTLGDYNKYRGWELPEKEDGSSPGFIIEYTDGGKPNMPNHEGYVSWSPADVFNKSYQETSGLTFGHAVEALLLGKRLARVGWNGKDMFVYYVPPNEYKVQTEAAKEYFGEDAMVPYNAYFAIKNTNETVSTWVPSINDCTARDWYIV